jgi:hypothetical protein
MGYLAIRVLYETKVKHSIELEKYLYRMIYQIALLF